jgi:hypothetical protein
MELASYVKRNRVTAPRCDDKSPTIGLASYVKRNGVTVPGSDDKSPTTGLASQWKLHKIMSMSMHSI